MHEVCIFQAVKLNIQKHKRFADKKKGPMSSMTMLVLLPFRPRGPDPSRSNVYTTSIILLVLATPVLMPILNLVVRTPIF